jgi:Fe-S cluster biogenesis protein NfuA
MSHPPLPRPIRCTADPDRGPGARRRPPARQNVGVENHGPDMEESIERPALSDEERGARLAQLQGLMDLMRPAVQADGGDLVLVSADVESGVVEVQLQGACSSCAISSATLQGGVERILRDRLPWVTEVTGGLTETIDPYESASLGQGAYVPRL